MTNEQIKALTAKYRATVQAQGFRPKCAPLDTHIFYESASTATNHALWMLDEIDRMAVSIAKREKIMRWLGFVQGVLWAGGHYSIDEMRADNSTREPAVLLGPPANMSTEEYEATLDRMFPDESQL